MVGIGGEFSPQYLHNILGSIAHTCNPSTGEVETIRLLGLAELQISEISSQRLRKTSKVMPGSQAHIYICIQTYFSSFPHIDTYRRFGLTHKL